MFEFLAYRKETENKYRWDADIEGVKFSLYIPKWRVPDGLPGTIYVRIYDVKDAPRDLPAYTRMQIEQQPGLREEKIIARIKRCRDHTKTVRFDPIGDPKNWEIGSPYIPDKILPKADITELIIEIEWS